MIKLRYLIILFTICIFQVSCSGGGNPINPQVNQINDGIQSNDGIALADPDSTGFNARYPGVFGAWEFVVNPLDLTYEMIPARNAQAIGSIFDSDLSQFLTVSPCSNCMRISEIHLNLTPPDFRNAYSTLDVTFEMRHPFENIAARPDLHGFDVRLIIIGSGYVSDFPAIMVMNPDGTEVPASLSDELVLNADGFTSHYDQLVTDERYFINGSDVDGNLNPYLRFFEDSSTAAFDPDAPAGHNVIPVGPDTENRTVIFNIIDVMDYLHFYAVADVAYGQSAVLANRHTPQYYLPAFNRTEAWRVEYWIENNNLSATDSASTADVVVQVFDWQQGATVDPAYPNSSNLAGIRESSNVARVELSVPDFQNGLITATFSEGGTGAPTDPLQYRLTITNENLNSDSATGLLAVRDELYGHASPSGRIPVPESPAGFPYETQDIRDYTCYYPVNINMPHHPAGDEYMINGELFVFPGSRFADGGETLMIASHFMDPSSSKFDYYWDFDYDGITFDIEGTDFPFQVINGMESGLQNVGLRVMTTSVPPRVFTYTIPVYVEGDWLEEVSNTTNLATTYNSRENAMAMTEDYYYIAYTQETAGKRDIVLTIYDKWNMEAQGTNLTAVNPGNFYNPSLEVIESGPNAGIYVAFSSWDSGEIDLYSINGTQTGLTLTAPVYRTLTADGTMNENNVCLYYDDETPQLLAYYAREDAVMGYEICVSSWDLSPAGWIYRSRIHNPADGGQNYPTVAVDGYYGNIYVAWQDGRDYATRAYDIYMASSPDGILFAEPENISTISGLILDMYPSIAITGRQIGVAYLSIDPAALTSEVHVALIDSALGAGSIFDHQVVRGGSRLQTLPSIASAVEGRFTLTYGAFDDATDDLDEYVIELINEGAWTLTENEIYLADAGTISSSAANTYPGVISRPVAGGTGVENFIAFRTFINGNTDSASPFPMRFGEVQIVGIITEGNEFEF